MSTNSLLSNGAKEAGKKNSMLSNRTNYESSKKLNFKINSKTPSNLTKDSELTSKFLSSTIGDIKSQFAAENLSDEEKLRRFHKLVEETKYQLFKKSGKEFEILPMMNKS